MRVFLTGANGWIGQAVVRELVSVGHSVVGLVRSPGNAKAVVDVGGTPLLGSLADLDTLRKGAGEADGIIHTAFGLDLSRYETLADEDRQAIETFGDVFAGSGRPIVVTSGLGLLPDGETFTEDARPPVIPEYPRASEQAAFGLAQRGLRVSVVRPARSVHGPGERHGFIPIFADIARRKGVSAWIGDGNDPWPAVHRLDAARLYRLVLERGGRDEAFHAVAENVPFRLVAEAVGRQVGVPARSLARDEARAHFGALAVWVEGGGSASSERTRAALNWEPRQKGLIADIDRAEYLD